MPRYPLAGITNLSQLNIDADKDWAGKGITNLKEVAALMARGDLVVRGTTVLVRVPPGLSGTILTSAGPGNLPAWMPVPGPLENWLSAQIELGHVTGIEGVDASQTEPVSLSETVRAAYLDAPLEFIKRVNTQVGLARTATTGITPASTQTEAGPLASQYELNALVGGAVADDGGVQTDQTAAAKNPTANDMTLLPAIPAVGDAYYLGHANLFDLALLNLTTQGIGVWTIIWEYWNGAWAPLAGVSDGSNGFTSATGWRVISFTRPGNWVLTTILGMNRYWTRARVSAYTSITQQPLGGQAKVGIIG